MNIYNYFYHVGVGYYKALGGRNCPLRDMISSREDCKAAGFHLGYPYVGVTKDHPDYTAGCYWRQSGGIYFNPNLNTSPKWKTNGGICARQGKSLLSKYRK